MSPTAALCNLQEIATLGPAWGLPLPGALATVRLGPEHHFLVGITSRQYHVVAIVLHRDIQPWYDYAASEHGARRILAWWSLAAGPTSDAMEPNHFAATGGRGRTLLSYGDIEMNPGPVTTPWWHPT